MKWDASPAADVLPMWVADMDFRSAPAIASAVAEIAARGVYGYGIAPDSYFDAVIAWFSRRHGLNLRREWIIPVTGVLPGLAATLRALCAEGDKVIVQTPVYSCFFPTITENGCVPLQLPLLRGADGRYEMDFEALEQAASDPRAKLLLLCSPHNPTGRVWSREELERVEAICRRHSTIVVADEIHCDLVAPGLSHLPYAALGSEFPANCVMLSSPTKGFNIAGLQIANIFVSDPGLRSRIALQVEAHRCGHVNIMGQAALEAAYRDSEDWLDALNAYLHDNFLFLKDFLARELPSLSVSPLEGTYLVWLDCRSLGCPSVLLEKELLEKARVRLNAGKPYGEGGEGFLRINIACPRALLEEGLNRIANLLKQKA